MQHNSWKFWQGKIDRQQAERRGCVDVRDLPEYWNEHGKQVEKQEQELRDLRTKPRKLFSEGMHVLAPDAPHVGALKKEFILKEAVIIKVINGACSAKVRFRESGTVCFVNHEELQTLRSDGTNNVDKPENKWRCEQCHTYKTAQEYTECILCETDAVCIKCTDWTDVREADVGKNFGRCPACVKKSKERKERIMNKERERMRGKGKRPREEVHLLPRPGLKLTPYEPARKEASRK